jgi:hypothetical protein
MHGKPNQKPNKDINLLQCNPSTLTTTRTTCLPQDMLERLRDEWNTRYPNHKIPLSIHRKERLWKELRLRLQNKYKCDSEYCAVQELGPDTVKNDSAQYFRPKKPTEWIAKPREWHDSETLARVMEQYESAYPAFEFIGPTPIDFDKQTGIGKCVMDELCNMDLKGMSNAGTKFVGIIFNLDPHDKPGSHWVCSFIDLIQKTAYYYDSYGFEPCAEIRRLLRRCREQGCKDIIWNDIRHQRKSSECGTYCMYVIISLLKGRGFGDICNNRVDDDTMNALRDIFYATERPSQKAIEALKTLTI